MKSASDSRGERAADRGARGEARARRGEAEAAPGATELRCCRLKTPLGALTLVESELGLVAVEKGALRGPALRGVVQRLGLGSEPSPREVDELPAARQLAEYFAGQRREFVLPLDERGLSGFRLRVLRLLAEGVRFGEATTYGELASRLGVSGGARAVGGAVGANPWLIVVPCHRVLAADGALGGFSSGLPTKRALLRHEGICWREPTRGAEEDGARRCLA